MFHFNFSLYYYYQLFFWIKRYFSPVNDKSTDTVETRHFHIHFGFHIHIQRVIERVPISVTRTCGEQTRGESENHAVSSAVCFRAGYLLQCSERADFVLELWESWGRCHDWELFSSILGSASRSWCSELVVWKSLPCLLFFFGCWWWWFGLVLNFTWTDFSASLDFEVRNSWA